MNGDSDDTNPQFTRRRYLGVLGSASAAVAVGATQIGSADASGYGQAEYGSGAYGGQTTDTETALDVRTVGSSGVGPQSATLTGELTELQNHESASVYFEWGRSNESLPNVTSEQTLETTGEFEATLSDLDTDSDYEFRSVATADGSRETGETATFRTEQESSEDEEETDEGETDEEETNEGFPEIEKLTGEDVSNPRNPHVDPEISWRATIDNSELYAASLRLSDADGEIESWTYDLSGDSAEATESTRLPHRAREDDVEYTVDLIVYSYYGNIDEQTTTFRAQ